MDTSFGVLDLELAAVPEAEELTCDDDGPPVFAAKEHLDALAEQVGGQGVVRVPGEGHGLTVGMIVGVIVGVGVMVTVTVGVGSGLGVSEGFGG